MPTVDEFRFARGTAPWLVGGSSKDKQGDNMYIELTITAVADRDPSCNLFTYTEAHRFSIAMPPSTDKLKELMEKHKVKYLEMWPHNGVAKPHLVPLDATITEKE